MKEIWQWPLRIEKNQTFNRYENCESLLIEGDGSLAWEAGGDIWDRKEEMYHPGDSQRKKVTSAHSAEEGKDFLQNGLIEKTERPTFCMRVREGHVPINCSRYTAKTFLKSNLKSVFGA